MNVVADSKDSILAVVAGIIAPVFLPLGFGNWKISTALITGFMAKESVVQPWNILRRLSSTRFPLFHRLTATLDI